MILSRKHGFLFVKGVKVAGTSVEALLSRLGITRAPALKHYKQGLSSNSLNLPDFFSPQQLGTINTLFAEEFERFGYPMAG